jgi:hypothetical protein
MMRRLPDHSALRKMPVAQHDSMTAALVRCLPVLTPSGMIGQQK